MPGYGDILAGSLANFGSGIFKGLAQGRAAHQEEEDLRLKREHQGFLDRLQTARLKLEQDNQQRLAEYLKRPQVFGDRMLERDPTGSYRLTDLPAKPETPGQRATRELHEAQTREIGKAKPTSDPEKELQAARVKALRDAGVSDEEISTRVFGPPATKQPTSMDAWQSRAMDPTLSPEDRAHAQRVADAIEARHVRITGEGAGAGARARSEVKDVESTKKAEKSFARTTTMLDQMDVLIPKLAAKGFMMTGPGMPAYWTAKAKRSHFSPIGQPGDPDLAAWNTHESTMVSVARDLGDLGPRAIQAFAGVQRIVSEPTTPEGARAAIRQLREAVTAYKTGRAQEFEGGQPVPSRTPSARGGMPEKAEPLTPDEFYRSFPGRKPPGGAQPGGGTMRIRRKSDGKILEGPAGPIPAGFEKVGG